MESAIQIFKKHHGYAYLKDLKKEGVHTDTVRKMIGAKIIEKVKPGLYKLTDMPVAAYQGYIDVCTAISHAVVCLHSALSYYELTTQVPSLVMVAMPRGRKPKKVFYPPMKVFHYSPKIYLTGILTKKTRTGSFRIYDAEKTLVDCFRYRRRLGEDVAVEGLKNYFKRRGPDIHKILEYAKQGRMSRVMKPYLESLAGS